MAEDINSSASFGQNKNDGEELPIIVAQRFLNIFRQLHIFSDERREAFNKMLLELPQEVKNIFQSLPGGTPLQEYMEDLEQKSKGLEPVTHHEHKKNTNILQEALESQHSAAMGGGANVISGDFAKILANSLAQSNAEIIKELQNSRPMVMSDGKGGAVSFDSPMKLIADESFTNIISKALTEAIENSEKKRLEDNKIIAQSFMELQENLTKLIEQNSGQIKFAATGEKGGIVPVKGIVDDLVKAQSEFLKETTKNQKDELSSIISTAIKESQKVSTQALIDSFKQIGSGSGPAPITYAASSPKGAPTIESVEQALKAQGKEFSSIISMAIKESQKNSAQTIAETIESLKKDTSFGGGQNNLKVEEIMRMQANLFRDIARAQNQEFSALISAALKESQKQSTQAIIAALEQLQTRPVQTVAVPMPIATTTASVKSFEEKTSFIDPAATAAPVVNVQNVSSESAATPFIDKYMESISADDNEEESDDEKLATESVEETSKKKKKKKKKKNKGNSPVSDNQQNLSEASNNVVSPQDSDKIEGDIVDNNNKIVTDNSKTVSNKAEQTAKIEAKDEKSEKKDLSPAQTENSVSRVTEKAAAQVTKPETPVEEKSSVSTKPQTSMLEKLMTISTAFSTVEDIKDNDVEDWGWGTTQNEIESNTYGNYNQNLSNNTASTFQYDDDSTPAEDYGNDQDWEWEYEEVPADAEMSGEEGQDWEWEYEEVPADAEMSGEEGQDWSYDDNYAEENADNDISGATQNIGNANSEDEYEYDYEESVLDNSLFNLTPEEFAESSEISFDHLPQLVLLGLEDENFRDPYIENSDNIG